MFCRFTTELSNEAAIRRRKSDYWDWFQDELAHTAPLLKLKQNEDNVKEPVALEMTNGCECLCVWAYSCVCVCVCVCAALLDKIKSTEISSPHFILSFVSIVDFSAQFMCVWLRVFWSQRILDWGRWHHTRSNPQPKFTENGCVYVLVVESGGNSSSSSR